MRLILLTIVLIAGIMLIKTLTFSSKQIVGIEAIEQKAIDAKALNRFSEAIQIPTVASPTLIDTSLFSAFDTLLQNNFPKVHQELERTTINEFSFIYKWPGTNTQLEPVLLMGHYDVVPVEEASADKWLAKPFGGELKEGKIWGRGTLDDKLNVMGILEAVEMLLAEDYQPTRTIYLSFGHDEEVSGKKGGEAIANYFEKNKIQFGYVLDEGQVVVSNALSGLNQPLAMIGIAEKGYTTLTLTAQLSEGGHSSMPPPETAVGVLSKAIYTLQENPFPIKLDGVTGMLFEYAGAEMTWLYKMLFANLWITEGLLIKQLSKDPAASALLRTTTAPTMLRGGVKENVLPTKASAKINFRIIPGETVASVMEQVRTIVDDKRILVQESEANFSSEPAAVSSTDSFGFRVVQRTIQQIFPDAIISPSLVIAATDSRYFQKVAKDVYRFQPILLSRAELKGIHGVNESVSVENYHRAINFYRQLILNSGK